MKELIIKIDEEKMDIEGNAPLVDRPKELVRCKDCGYSLFKEGMVQPGYIVCTKPFTERWQAVKPNDWFCADGKRRDDDD